MLDEKQKIEAYAEQHSKLVHEDWLRQLEWRTELETTQPQMLSGYLQGQFLAMLSRMLRPKRIVEIGTFTGFSALCLAHGLAEGGELHTLEINPELAELAQSFWEKAGLKERIHLHIGNAIELLDEIEGPYDLVFIDADKLRYPDYYDLVFPKVPIGGYILIDNVWWHGKLFDKKDKRAEAIRGLNQRIQEDERVHNVFLPLRDGLMLVEKIRES